MSALTARMLPRLISAGCLALISGCAVVPGESVEGRSTLALGQALSPLSVPYGQMSVSIDGGRTGRMMLATTEGSNEYWLAADGQALWLQGGRVVGTQGLPENLFQVQPVVGDWPPLQSVVNGRDGLRFDTTMFYESDATGPVGQIAIVSLESADDALSVVIDGSTVRFEKVIETVTVPATGEHWRNYYWWHEPSRQWVASRQRIPGTPYEIRFSRLFGPATESRK